MSKTGRYGVLGVFVLVVLLCLLAAGGAFAADGPAYGPHDWNSVWSKPYFDAADQLFWKVKMDDPWGPGKVEYTAKITFDGEESLDGYFHVYGSYVFYDAGGNEAWFCSRFDHYFNEDLNVRGMGPVYAGPEVAVGVNDYAGWEAHLVGGMGGSGAYMWTMKGWFQSVP